MKKFFSFFAATALMLSFAACDKKDKNEPDQPIQDTTQVDPSKATELTMSGIYMVEADYGMIYIIGTATDGSKGLSVCVYPAKSVNTDVTDDNVIASSTFLADLDAEGKVVKSYELSSVALKTKVNMSTYVMTVTGTFEANSVKYDLTLTAQYYEEESDEYEWDEETPFSASFATYTINDEFLEDYGDLIIEASAADGKYIGLDMYSGAATLLPGEYTISDSGEAFTVYPGSTDGEYLYWSFAGIEGEEGYTNVWYLVSGKVTVNEDGSIVVNAVNSNEQAIQCTLAAPAASAPAKAKAQKGQKGIKRAPFRFQDLKK